MKKNLLYVLFAVICAISCVNQEYDLNKLDTEMTLFGQEGIEIPLPESDPAELDVFKSNVLSDNLLHKDGTGSVSEVDFSNVDSKQLDEGLKVEGEFRFDLSDYPASFRSEGTEIVFGDNSYFIIMVDNTSSASMMLSCEVFDGKKNALIGKADGLTVAPGLNQEVRILFNKAGMVRLPEEAVIKNIVLRSVPVKSGISGALKFVDAGLDMDSVIGKGSILAYDYAFIDFFEEVSIDVEALQEYVDAKSFVLNATLFSDLPVSFSGTADGDVTASLSFESPTPEGGLTISMPIECPNGIMSVKSIKLNVKFTAKTDIDLATLDTYEVSVSPESIKLDKGIVVGK